MPIVTIINVINNGTLFSDTNSQFGIRCTAPANVSDNSVALEISLDNIDIKIK